MRNPFYVQNPRREMAAFIIDGYESVLELGCSDGAFSASLAPECEYWGVDPALSEGNGVRQVHKRLICAGIEEALVDIPHGYFDLIIANDVLEHLVDPFRILRELRGLLKQSGTLVGSVPNVRHVGVLWDLLVRRDWRYREQGVLDQTHLRFFTAKSLVRMLSECGFVVEQAHGINSELLRARAARRLGLICCIAATFGWLSDARYPQIGFRARHG